MREERGHHLVWVVSIVHFDCIGLTDCVHALHKYADSKTI